MPLPPYVEEPLNSKVIKSFVPEQRSRQVFFVFRDPMFYVIYVIYVMNIPCTFRIFMYMAMVHGYIYIYIYWFCDTFLIIKTSGIFGHLR